MKISVGFTFEHEEKTLKHLEAQIQHFQQELERLGFRCLVATDLVVGEDMGPPATEDTPAGEVATTTLVPDEDEVDAPGVVPEPTTVTADSADLTTPEATTEQPAPFIYLTVRDAEEDVAGVTDVAWLRAQRDHEETVGKGRVRVVRALTKRIDELVEAAGERPEA